MIDSSVGDESSESAPKIPSSQVTVWGYPKSKYSTQIYPYIPISLSSVFFTAFLSSSLHSPVSDPNMTIGFKEALARLENSRVKSTRPLIPPQILQEDLPLYVFARLLASHS